MIQSATVFAPPGECEQPYTVSDINEGVASLIESGNTLVWVSGELSTVRRASSGHIYLKLKDEGSQIPAVMWRSNADRLDFDLEDGMAVTVIASLRVYRKGGYYQLDIHRVQSAGLGALYAALEELKRKLSDEGLFDESHKKPLPETVATLGVVTAGTGAAIRDILRVVASRAPHTDILLRSVSVQGESAPKEIETAIRELNEHGKADCIIVGRGGGSFEDLLAFSDERVVRAIYESGIPVISAVGHEIDFMLSDFAADVRAPTPSTAAEIAVADREELQRYIEALQGRFSFAIRHYFSSLHATYRDLAHSPGFRRALRTVSDARQTTDDLQDRALRAAGHTIKRKSMTLSHAAGELGALSPLAVLARGYSVVLDQCGSAVTRAGQLSVDDLIHIRFRSSNADARVTSVGDE